MQATALVVAFLALAPSSPYAAQPTGSLTGTVTDTLTIRPVPGAVISLESPTVTRDTTTDTAGRYTFAGVPPGPYHLVLRLNGYLPARREVTIEAAALTLDVGLDPELHFSEVTAVSPEGRSQFESFQATNVLGGQDLAKALGSTIGATLADQPGVAVRSFGPGPARPVIRGLDGDRVLLVENGLRMGDLSSQSGDHGVTVNPASASTIEVVRGPATLLYGANAIGGLVNIVTNDIPTAPVTRATGMLTVNAATAAPGAGVAGDVSVGNGRFAVHLAGSGQDADNYGTPEGDVPNSFNRGGAMQVGAAYTATRGYLGASYSHDRTHYGIPFVEEGETSLDPRRQNVTVRGERREMSGLFSALKGSFAVRRYRHDELDGEEVATAFANDTTELELLGHHRRLGRLSGSIGGAYLTRSFSATGEEALAPEVHQRGGAAYLYEELALAPHAQLQFGGRIEHAGFDPQTSDEPGRDFTNVSGSAGLLLLPTDYLTLAFSVARASRNPALEELYFHGPHPGNNAIENGDPSLDSEHALGLDASIRWRGSRASGEVTVFASRIDDFIYR